MSETIAPPILRARRLQYDAWNLAADLLVNHGDMVHSSKSYPDYDGQPRRSYWSTGYMLRGAQPTETDESTSYPVARLDVIHENSQEESSELRHRDRAFYEDVLIARESPFAWRRCNARERLQAATNLTSLELSLGVATVGALSEDDATRSVLYREAHLPRRKQDAAYCDAASRKRKRNDYLLGVLESDPDVECALQADRAFVHDRRTASSIRLFRLPADHEKAFLGLGGELSTTVSEYDHSPEHIERHMGPLTLAVTTMQDVQRINRPLRTVPGFSAR